MFLNIEEPLGARGPEVARIAVGIDLGTTHSLVAVSLNGTAVPIPGAPGEPLLLPSVVAWPKDPTHAPLVGAHARSGWMDPAVTVAVSTKRDMGSGAVLPIRTAAEILKSLMRRAEVFLDAPVHEAVISVPAYFDDAARSATKDAAALAGISVLRLIHEPTAAALAYGLEKGKSGLYAVYDLGGGTFDVSILSLEAGVFQVLATGGDTRLGGDDIDTVFLAHLQGRAPTLMGPTALWAARTLKEKLSFAPEAEIAYALDDTTHHNLRATRLELEATARPFISKSIEIVGALLKDAGLKVRDIQGVIAVGGATRMPLVQEALTAFFEKAPLVDLDPDTVVALGAALQAEALTSARGTTPLLMDVTPLSLGLETMGGIVEKILPRGSPIPAMKTQDFTTFKDNQTALSLHIVQGERECAADCRSLARMSLAGIPRMPAGKARIRVTYMVDADGLLQVSAEELSTGVRQSIHVHPTSGVTPEEMAEMILLAAASGAADMQGRLLRASRVQAEGLYAAALKAFEHDADMLTREEHAAFQSALQGVQDALIAAPEDRDALDAAREHLEALLMPFSERRLNKAIAGLLVGKTVAEIG